MSGICHVGLHRRRWVAHDGADHTGLDVWLRCTNCGRRTISHVECHVVTPEIVRVLNAEWAKETTRKEIFQ